MANRYRNLIYSTAEYTQLYGGFKGVELNAGSLISSKSRLAYSQNMYKDYDGDGADVIESVPGYRCFAQYGKRIHAIYYQRAVAGGEDHIIVHVENKLMRHPVSDIHKKNCVGTQIATVENKKSSGFEYGRYFFIMDTVSIYRIDETGECKAVGEGGAYPYVPTTYVSGEEYEQRNLLTNDFKEEFYIADPCAYLYATEGVKFTITDPYLRYCSVSGLESSVSGDVYLPSYVNIAGVEYKVTAIDDYAFADNKKITALYIPHGITEMGRRALSKCDALKTLVTPSTLTSIGAWACYCCYDLTDVYLGAGITNMGENIFAYCDSLSGVNYALGEEEMSDVEGISALGSLEIVYYSKFEDIKLSLSFHDKVKSISEVTVNDGGAIFSEERDGEIAKSAIVHFDSLTDATGAKVVIRGVLAPLDSSWSRDMTALEATTPDKAIASCTTAEVFDGRIFFSGNPRFPNTVFYTERARAGHDGAIYVGRYNYFNDGVGSHKVRAMLAVRDMLAVFKEGDDGSGSIFYHKKEYTSLDTLDTIYPVAYVHSGIGAVGECLSFLDDPVFLTNEGLMALNSENINYQRNVVCRSHNVNYTLLKEDLSRVSLCEWLGYLVLGVNGKILLADSRAIFKHATGAYEYEWFLLTDVGTYTSDHAVYRYADEPFADAVVYHSKIGEAADHERVYSAKSGDEMYYYVSEGTKKYRVIPTEEREGGIFSAATVFISHGNLLLFATDDGHVCVFNNDMRGIAPESVRESAEYVEEEYQIAMGNKIHPLYYSFAGHAPKYVIKTALDDCGVPHLTKSSVKGSLVVKARSHTSDAITCEVSTDASEPVYVGSFPAAHVSFDDFSFSDAPWYVSKYTSVPLPEKEKRWIEKQITLTSEKYASPISIYSISYRYVIKGKIKNTT